MQEHNRLEFAFLPGLKGGRRVRFKSHKPATDTFYNVLGFVIVLGIQPILQFSHCVFASERVLSLLLPAFSCKSGGRQLQLVGLIIKVTLQIRCAVPLIPYSGQNLAYLQLRRFAVGRLSSFCCGYVGQPTLITQQ